jgi:hypothetical protein
VPAVLGGDFSKLARCSPARRATDARQTRDSPTPSAGRPAQRREILATPGWPGSCNYAPPNINRRDMMKTRSNVRAGTGLELLVLREEELLFTK